MQKRASGGAGVPQLGQRCSNLAPQDMQKRAPAGLSIPHAAQLIAREYSGFITGLCDAGHISGQLARVAIRRGACRLEARWWLPEPDRPRSMIVVARLLWQSRPVTRRAARGWRTAFGRASAALPLVGLLVLPPAASAATATAQGRYDRELGYYDGTVRFTAAPGERNRLTISRNRGRTVFSMPQIRSERAAIAGNSTSTAPTVRPPTATPGWGSAIATMLRG